MSEVNITVSKEVQRKRRLYRAVRRADIIMQVRKKIAEKGLKGVDMAQRLGVSEANLSRWLGGKQNLTLDTLYLLADALEEPLSLQIGVDVRKASHSDSEGPDLADWRLSDSSTWGNVVDLAPYQRMRTNSKDGNCGQLDAPHDGYVIGEFDECSEIAA